MSTYETIEIAFLEEWEDTHPDGKKIDPEMLSLAVKYFRYAHESGKDRMQNYILKELLFLKTRDGFIKFGTVRDFIKNISI